MILLIDYDNLGRLKKNRLSQVVEILTEKIPSSNDTSPTERVNCRLYGGWLWKGNRPTRRAQNLSKQIRRDFPRSVQVSDRERVMKKPELAISLACDPGNNFPNTFRIRPGLPSLNVKQFPLQECAEPANCGISVVNSFWQSGNCIRTNCQASPEDVFYRAEQKLVDSMIVVDLIHYATHQNEHVVLVSGDDDMWPGIRYALLNKTQITHLAPKLSGKRFRSYKHLFTSHYSFVEL